MSRWVGRRTGVTTVEETEYPIVVDYGQTLEQMIACGNYNHVDRNITEDAFPIRKFLEGVSKEEVTIKFVHFDRDIGSDLACKEIKLLGLRVAVLPELLALGAFFQENQPPFPIVALGSVGSDVWGIPSATHLSRWRPSRRDLCLRWCRIGWGAYCRFAVV